MALGNFRFAGTPLQRLALAGLMCAALLLPMIIATGCSRDSAPSADGTGNGQISGAEPSPAFRNLGKRAESQL
jgi:hypothetical protein